MKENSPHPHLILVPRKAVVALTIAWFVLFILVIGSYQYANFVDRRSNRHWCGIVTLFNESYKQEPPTTATGKVLEVEFRHLEEDFSCK